jgi:hypothetical protein
MTDRRLSILIIEDSESDAALIVREFLKVEYDINRRLVETGDRMRVVGAVGASLKNCSGRRG